MAQTKSDAATTRPGNRPITWGFSIAVLIGIGWVEGALIGTGSYLLLLTLLGVAVGFVFIGHHVRRRWGGWGLAGVCIIAILVSTVLLARVFLYALEVRTYITHLKQAMLFSVLSCACGLALEAIVLHRSGRAARRLDWDVPVGLIGFAVGELAGFALAMAYMIVTTPVIG